MVEAYWLIGQRIVSEEQKGEERAELACQYKTPVFEGGCGNLLMIEESK